MTWGGVIRHRESQITVQYPTEVYDDDEITPTGFQPRPRSHPSSSSSSSSPSSSSQPISFLRGWNFVVDLYRILEHAADRLRARRLGGDATVDAVTRLYTGQHGPDPMDVMNTVTRMYDDLPGEFKRAKEMTGDSEADRYGYTGAYDNSTHKIRWDLGFGFHELRLCGLATNIIITMQTLRMVISGTEEANVHQRCAIAAEMLDALGSMPTSYIQSSSAPMVRAKPPTTFSPNNPNLLSHAFLLFQLIYTGTLPLMSSCPAPSSRWRRSSPRISHPITCISTYLPPSPNCPSRPSRFPSHPRNRIIKCTSYRCKVTRTRFED